VANGSTQDCQRRKSMRGQDLMCLSSRGVSVLNLPEVEGYCCNCYVGPVNLLARVLSCFIHDQGGVE